MEIEKKHGQRLTPYFREQTKPRRFKKETVHALRCDSSSCAACSKASGKVDEFRTYVRPEQNPTLSQFCTKLTGITQEQVRARTTVGCSGTGTARTL